MTDPLRLYTFSISHFSEKIRWTLALEKIPFEEVQWVPSLHVVSARRSGGATTVPVLEAGHTRVQDSTRILHWLDTNRGPLSLLPESEADRERALEIEKTFDDVGSHVIRLAYAQVLPDTDAVVRLWTIDASPMQARTVRAAFPLLRMVFRRRLDTAPARVEASRAAVEKGLAFIEERTASRPFLVGDRLSIADITAASLLAPLACPDEHAVYSTARYRAGIEPVAEAWRTRPAFAWVRGIYRAHRGPWDHAAHVARALAE